MERRTFIRNAAIAGVSLQLSPAIFTRGMPSERIRLVSIGSHSRGLALAQTTARLKNVEFVYVCDTDSRVSDITRNEISKITGKKPAGLPDFRKALEDKSVDGVIIATPDHWHAPATILACAAGKHVYVEKPCSHNPAEGELMVQAARKYNRIVQMGSQRRSWDKMIEAVSALHDGIIGRVFFAQGWYTNDRAPIGVGKLTDVPSWLNYDLWQGPAPRTPYKDNLIHYNWHWHWKWGTGEALNNGTHEVDMMRWGLNVDYPSQVTSGGGRFMYSDDWETPDTQVITWEFPGNKACTWEGRSCNNLPVEGSGRGVIFFGEKGSMIIPGGNGYKVLDPKNKVIKEVAEVRTGSTPDKTNTVGPGEALDGIHLQNYLDCIRSGKSPNADIETGRKSTLLVQLGNIAFRTRQALDIDPATGHPKSEDAMKLWSRSYEPGWEPEV